MTVSNSIGAASQANFYSVQDGYIGDVMSSDDTVVQLGRVKDVKSD